MSNIVKNAQYVADTIQSLDIKATYELMVKFTKCLETLSMIAQEANKLEKENAELKKALGIDDEANNAKKTLGLDDNAKESSEPEISIEPVSPEDIPEGAELIQ